MSYKRLDPEDIVISDESVTSPTWTGDIVTLSSFYTSSTQAASTSGDYYLDVYQTTPATDGAAVQFSLAYGDKVGSGSVDLTSGVSGKSPSAITYGQYKALILSDKSAGSQFTFGSVESPYFYAINFERSRFKEKLLPGTFELTLNTTAGTIVLKDNSTSVTTDTFTDAGRVYTVVSSSGADPSCVNDSGSYGSFYPDVGIILLNGQVLDASFGDGGLALGTSRTSNTDTSGSQLIFDAISDGASFKLNSEETLSSNFVFVRARNSEFNYSVNPSILTGSGDLKYDVLVDTPRTYITAVGLYNDTNDLLAVAKLSRPLLKNFTKEALIRVKLNY